MKKFNVLIRLCIYKFGLGKKQKNYENHTLNACRALYFCLCVEKCMRNINSTKKKTTKAEFKIKIINNKNAKQSSQKATRTTTKSVCIE